MAWKIKQKLAIAFELYTGIDTIPNTSELSFFGSLLDLGWKQSALSLTYNISVFEGAEFKIILGNGEGKLYDQSDVQKFLHLSFLSIQIDFYIWACPFPSMEIIENHLHMILV